MPVQKFRSIQDTPDPPWKRPGDPDLSRALADVWRVARLLAPRRFPPGVYRHRTMEDLNRQRDEWDAEYVRALLSFAYRAGLDLPDVVALLEQTDHELRNDSQPADRGPAKVRP